jgi:glycosyltransferase involved in cell wall biosynthesis
MKKFPLLSIVIPVLNGEKFLHNFFTSLKKQTIISQCEIIVVDGQSTDNTVKIAKKFGAVVFNNSYQLAEPGVSLGIAKSQADLITIMAIDNFFKDKFALSTLIKIFENPIIYAAFPKHISSENDSIFSKYINTFTDPFTHFVYGDASNARTFKNLYSTISHNDKYDVYDYKSHPIKPIIALAQGLTIRKSILANRREKYDDIDPIYQLIKQNKQIAYVHSVDLIHHTINNIFHFIRRQRWTTYNYLTAKKQGINLRLKYITLKQKIKIVLFPLYALTFFPSLFIAIYKFFIQHKKLWLFHPIISFIAAISIVYEILLVKLFKTKRVIKL